MYNLYHTSTQGDKVPTAIKTKTEQKAVPIREKHEEYKHLGFPTL